METITLPVAAEVAETYRRATPEMRRKWELLFRYQLEFVLNRPRRPLEDIMHEMGEQAARNGLTEEILQDILREWDEERKAARR